MKKFLKIKNNIVEFAKENKLFLGSIIITIMFIVSPILIKCSYIRNFCSWLLNDLGEQGYKSSYIETLGAVLGTFLAISGALWTQRKFEQDIEQKEEEERRREKFLIIYYDFKFLFDDIRNNMFFFQYKKTGSRLNLLDDENVLLFRACFKNFKVHIHDEWIQNVASVSQYLTKDEIKTIYEMYGVFEELKQTFSESIYNVSEEELKIAYDKMFQYINVEVSFQRPVIVEVKLKDTVTYILEKLPQIGNF